MEFMMYLSIVLFVMSVVFLVLAEIYEARCRKEARIAAKKLAELDRRIAYEKGWRDGRGC